LLVGAPYIPLSEGQGAYGANAKVPGFLFSGLVALTLFIVIELLQARRGKRPLLDIRILTDRSLSAGLVASTVLFICLFSNSLLFPIYLQTLRGQTALQASLLLLPLALGTLVSMTLAGRLVDRLPDARVLIVPGIVLQILGMVLLMGITLTTPYWQFCLMVGLLGLANGLVMQPLSVASMVSIHSPEAVATGTTLSTVLRSVGGSLGTAVLATLTMMPAGQTRLVQLVGLHTVFLITIGLMVLAFLFVLLLRKKQEKPTSQAEPATV
jgi:MFS family permease